VEVESCAGSSGARASTSPFPGPRTSPAAGGANLQVSGSSHLFAVLSVNFVTRLLVISQHRLSRQLARYWNRPTSEGKFPFPLAPKFWGSWTDSWLKTNLPRTVPIVERGNSSFEPL
jgi:hypothetical protein